jgi:translation initiation factor RLI1
MWQVGPCKLVLWAGLHLTLESCGHINLLAAQVIRGLLGNKKYVIVVEHDLSVLDYLSDYICCLYGKPGAYGVVTMPFG